MTNGRIGFVSSWRKWAVRLSLGCALAGLVFSLPIEGGQARRKSHRPAKTAEQRITAHRTAPPPVELCVVVRNVRGLAVADLRSSDFRLWDNNRLQRISDFAANIVPESVHHVKTPGSGRYIALYFDDLHYDFVQTIRVTDSAYSYFKSLLELGNKVGVFTASGEVTLDFTDNREMLHHALLAIKPHISTARQAKACPELTDFQAQMLLYGDDPLALKIALEDMNACSTPKGQVDPPISSLPVATLRRMKQTIDARARQVIAESEIQSRKSLEGLDKLISRMSTLPDPRTIIVASPGFMAGSKARQIDLLCRRATRLHIIISALDTTGLLRQLPDPAPTHNTRLDEERESLVAAKNQMMADHASMAADVLQDLSTMTAGNFIANKDDLGLGFQAAIPLPPAYYVLGYKPTDSRENGRFHSVRVQVVRHGRMGVQAPPGYYAPGTAAEIARSSVRDRHSKGRRK
jgi:VWFA-related protein